MTRKFTRMLEKKEKKKTKEKQLLNDLLKKMLSQSSIQRYLNLNDEEYHDKCLLQHDNFKKTIDSVSKKINVSYYDLFCLMKKWLLHDVPESMFLHNFEAFDVDINETRQMLIEAHKTVLSISKIIDNDYKKTVYLLVDAYEYDWFEKYDDDISVISSFVFSDSKEVDEPNPEISSILVNFHDKFKEYDNSIKNKANFSLGQLWEQFVTVYVQSFYTLECAETLNISYEDAVEKTLTIQNSLKQYIYNDLVDGMDCQIEGAEYFFDIFKTYDKEISDLIDVQITL